MVNSIVSKFRGVTMVMVRMSILDGINGLKKLLGCQRVLTENSLYSLSGRFMGVSYILSTVCSILKRKNSSHIKRNVSVAKKYFSAKNIPMAIGKKWRVTMVIEKKGVTMVIEKKGVTMVIEKKRVTMVIEKKAYR
jgi:hypothetical protein